MDDTLKLIIENGLMVRQIPSEEVSVHDFRHHVDGNEIVEIEVADDGQCHKTNKNFNFYDGSGKKAHPLVGWDEFP